MKVREKIKKLAGMFRDGDKALVAIHDMDRDQITIESTHDIDEILIKVLENYIETQYSNFDGIQHDCIDFYRNKFNNLFDELEKTL